MLELNTLFLTIRLWPQSFLFFYFCWPLNRSFQVESCHWLHYQPPFPLCNRFNGTEYINIDCQYASEALTLERVIEKAEKAIYSP